MTPPNRSFFLLLAAALLVQPAASPQASTQSVELIRTDELKSHIMFLAGPDLKGRNAGSAEDLISADYVAAAFLRLGLKPGGENGTYFQNLDLVNAELDRDHIVLSAKTAGVGHNYSLNKDFRWTRQSLNPVSVCGSVVFAGYGISAPEYSYDDFANVDVRGKIVLVLNREPQANDPRSKFMGTWDTYHAFNWNKLEEIRKRGAAGLLLVQDRVRRDVKQIVATSPRPGAGPEFALAGQMWDIPSFTIQREVADQLLAPGGSTSDAMQEEIDNTVHPRSVEIPSASVCMEKAFTHVEHRPGRNVVAILEGSDPKLKNEAILVTAHHDHMGVSSGHTYYGADDDASGVAGLIEIANAFVNGRVRPKRSIIFASYDGEERIFLGSWHYVNHPVFPLDRTVATLNMDMIGRDEDDANWPVPSDRNINMVNVLGTRYNPGLRAVIDQENRRVGLKLDYKMDAVDPDSLWSRSDHFWFATLHIPQVEFQTGLHPDYHTDNDRWDRINYPKLTKIVRLVFQATVELANSREKISFVISGKPSDTRDAPSKVK